MRKEKIRVTSLGSFIACPKKFFEDKGKSFESPALTMGTVTHLSRQSPLLAKLFTKRLVGNWKLLAKEKIVLEKMIDVFADFNKTIPDKYEITFEADLQHKETLNNGEIEFTFTGHPDEIRINKETGKVEMIVDTKTAASVKTWTEGKAFDYAKQHIYYPYLLSKTCDLPETIRFVYRVIPKSYSNAEDIVNLDIEINVQKAIATTEAHLIKYFQALLNNNYPPKKSAVCRFCKDRKTCPEHNLITNF